MDKGALKDKRRETVIGLLKGMNIKKDSGDGFDKDDVYECVQQLCNLYEEHIEELEKNYESEISELTKRYHKYDENNELYVSLIMEAKKSSNEIINQAKSEVDGILENGKQQIALQEQQMEQFRQDSEKEKESIVEELRANKEVAEAEKAAMRVEIEAEKEKLEATKNKYRQQIASMDDEFSEIKTNLLRTSAKLDALKAQAEEITPEIKWDVEESAESVQVPEADIVVDDVIDIPEVAEVEEPKTGDEIFADTFFKSEVMEEAPKGEVAESSSEEIASIEDLLAGFDIQAEEEKPAEPAIEPAAEPAIELVAEPAEEAAVEAIEEPVIEAVEEAIAEPAEEAVEAVEAVTEAAEAAAEPVIEAAEPVQEEAKSVEELLDEISFDDILGDDATDEAAAEAAEAAEGVEEISLDDLKSLEAELPEEISFESLEALFKEE